MKIKMLTTSIHDKISGGTIFNSKLQLFLNSHFETKIEIVEDYNSYEFDKNHHYIIDGILISQNMNLERLHHFSVRFLMHLWPSLVAKNTIEKEKLETIEKQIASKFKLILTGENSKKHIEKTLKTSSNTIIISPGIETNWIEKKNFQRVPKKIIYLSNFIEGKGHFRLLDVLSKMKNTFITIDCFGEVLSEDYYQEFLNKKPNTINYKGIISHNAINELLLNYDLLLHFSDYESFGMGILETIATKIPVLITPVGNFENKLKKGVLPTFDAEEIAVKLEQICTSEENYLELITAVANFKTSSWEDNFKPLLDDLKTL
jgi:glycosyltransferase involved in cell wall biosynthesis